MDIMRIKQMLTINNFILMLEKRKHCKNLIPNETINDFFIMIRFIAKINAKFLFIRDL